MKFHPDRGQPRERPEAEEIFKMDIKAILSDPEIKSARPLSCDKTALDHGLSRSQDQSNAP